MAASACLWVAAVAVLGPARVLVLERADVLLHVALTSTSNRSRRYITVALSLAAAFLCCVPFLPQLALQIEPELVKTFEALDEGTKVTFASRFAMRRIAHTHVFSPTATRTRCPPPCSHPDLLRLPSSAKRRLPLRVCQFAFSRSTALSPPCRRSGHHLLPTVLSRFSSYEQWGGGKRLHAATVPIASVFAAAAALLAYPFASSAPTPLYFLPTFRGVYLRFWSFCLHSFETLCIVFVIPPHAHCCPVTCCPGIVIALFLLTASFYGDAVCVSRVPRTVHALLSSCAAAALAFASNRDALSSASAAAASSHPASSEAMFQFVVPSWAMMALSVVAVLFGMLGVRPQRATSAAAAGGGGSKQLPMFAVQGLGDDGDMTDDEHAKQVCCCFRQRCCEPRRRRCFCH